MASVDISDYHSKLQQQFEQLKHKRDIFKSAEFKALYVNMKAATADEKPALGKAINQLKQEFEERLAKHEVKQAEAAVLPLDVTAPFDINVAPTKRPQLGTAAEGSRHPLSTEREVVAGIFARMGFEVLDSRELDDDYHMFGSLNFPDGHPARDDYDTFVTEEGLIAPAHTSTMQNRILKSGEPPLASVVIGRCFRNEDLDAKHEHTLNQVEGVLVGEGINVGHLLATLQTFLESYYNTAIEFRTQPAYFPFVEPGFEFALSCPFCHKKGCATCGHEGWIELIGCGMIHPNVLREGGVDPKKYTGFAWGFGLDRLVMMKHAIEDIRYFQSGKLEFLRQFR